MLSALWDTGQYEIHQLAINHHGEFTQDATIPWQLQPAKLLDPKDPHGIKMFIKTLHGGDYDIVWVLNDLYVTSDATESLKKCFDDMRTHGKKIPKVIYYYPVDCHVPVDKGSFLLLADAIVCYTDHGKEETLKTFPGLENKLYQIAHGVDTSVFKPLSQQEAALMKSKMVNGDPDTTLVINVNRNNPRKQIPYSILAFKEFRKSVPKSKMYIHTAIVDQGGDIRIAIRDLGLNCVDDIILPINYSPSNPIRLEAMNMVYNVGDLFLTTHLGEGWGLTVSEAMAAGTPVVAPRNTSMPQLLGEHSERGYLYECKDTIWIDQSGFRPKGLIPDITETMLRAYHAGPKNKNPRCHAAIDWASKHTWQHAQRQWIELFTKILAKESTPIKNSIIAEEI